MRGPRRSLSEEFRNVWDKENRNPETLEFSPRTKKSRIAAVLEEVAARGEVPPVKPIKSWLDDLLGV
ncbi:hypothetical protein NEDG_01280 [Nematocida displodere]|uniref:Uncharacterized protein n=1 Tax=Nematocida displodere TaxID=1805483 RepID=A0A177EB90_9MICR|nr:hypothetical protein NEDG_01280 [Nematocida displodere]